MLNNQRRTFFVTAVTHRRQPLFSSAKVPEFAVAEAGRG
jgi:hypothetical protein